MLSEEFGDFVDVSMGKGEKIWISKKKLTCWTTFFSYVIMFKIQNIGERNSVSVTTQCMLLCVTQAVILTHKKYTEII